MTDQERYELGQEIVRDVEKEFFGRPMQEMVEEVRARVEKLMVTEGGSYCSYLMKPVEAQPERVRTEPVVSAPLRAFPDDFYYRPVITEDPQTARPTVDRGEGWLVQQPQHWIQSTENFGKKSHDDWGPRSEPPVPGLMCQCGHPAEAHAPACVHLIEGCGCEGFLKVPGGSVEGA